MHRLSLTDYNASPTVRFFRAFPLVPSEFFPKFLSGSPIVFLLCRLPSSSDCIPIRTLSTGSQHIPSRLSFNPIPLPQFIPRLLSPLQYFVHQLLQISPSYTFETFWNEDISDKTILFGFGEDKELPVSVLKSFNPKLIVVAFVFSEEVQTTCGNDRL
ncbi:hypothetical protein ACFX15_043421 [Malus domestica]